MKRFTTVAAIAALVALNEGSILPRFLQAASIHFMAFGPLAILAAVYVMTNVLTEMVTNNAVAAIIMPGVQIPHCAAPWRRNAA